MSLLPSVFVSYARTDSASIQYAVGLLEAGGAEVFRDIDDIRFGERWEDVITEQIQNSGRVLVFWSKAAAQSEWVWREYRMALQLGKTLVPVLLDETPLPDDLGAFHALTLSSIMPKTPGWKRYGGWVLGGVATVVLTGVLGLQVWHADSAQEVKMSAPAAPSLSIDSDDVAAGSSETTAVGGLRSDAQRESTAAVAVPEVSKIPPPASMKPGPVSSAGATDNNTQSAEEAAGSSASSAPEVEGMQLPGWLLWAAGLFSLLALLWWALRRFGRNKQVSEGERFVEMVFDDV